jgi:ligand-binding sensor domain-containing protein
MLLFLSGCGYSVTPEIPGYTSASNPLGETTLTPSRAVAAFTPSVSPTAQETTVPGEATIPPEAGDFKESTTPSPEETRAGLPRPPSGWTIYTNPDFVQGVALYENQLWAATLGGVVVWDIPTQKPTVYTTRDGLVEIQGNDVVYCRMPDERILVAHPSGTLSAYSLEGKRWSRIPITFDDGKTLSGVHTLLCDTPSQRLLVGSADGLGILDWRTGHWRRIGPEEGLNAGDIRAIDVVGQTIWVAAGDDSAFMIMGNTVFPFNSASGFPRGGVNDLAVAADQSVWFGYTTGLVHYQDKKWNLFGPKTQTTIPFLSVDHVEIGTDQLIWIASAEEGVCPFNPVRLFCSTIYPGTEGTPITDLVVDKNGIAYVGTGGKGVIVMDNEQVYPLSLNSQQLAGNDLLDIAGSSDGKIWVATDRGVNVFDPIHIAEPWETFAPQPGQMTFPRVRVLLPAANGMWLFYDQEPAASFYDGENWLHLNRQNGLSGEVMDAMVDQRGFVWMATTQGIQVWDGSVLRVSATPKSLLGNTYYVIKEIDNTIWAGSDQGLLRYQNYQWRVVLPGVSVQSIVTDQNGGLFLGTESGLIHYDGSQSFLWIINLGDELVISPKVTSITWDGLGQLWVGTDGRGLFRYNGKRWEQFNTASGMPSNDIRKVFTDVQGTIWAAVATGEGGGALVRYVP